MNATTRRRMLPSLEFAFRDDQKVAEALFNEETVDSVHPLAGAGLLDGLFVFMNDIGYVDWLSRFNILDYKRMMLPLTAFTLPYIGKVALGIKSMNAVPQLLFANTVLMDMLGFNAQIRSQGLCKRGQHARSDDKDPPKPYCVQTLAN